MSEEQRNELQFERDARVRLERELKKETQTRALAEQELQLAKKQFDVHLQLKDTEVQTAKTALAAATRELHERDERHRLATLEAQQLSARQQEDARQQLARVEAQAQAQVDAAQTQTAQLSAEKQQLVAELESATERLEQQAAANANAGNNTLADEEKQLYMQQLALLQEQVKEFEAAQFQRVQDDLATGRLGSPPSSPRADRTASFKDDECPNCARVTQDADAKAEAAARALATAQALKREATEMVASSSGSGTGASRQADREKLTTLFKEAVNEMFFRFQDVFEEDEAGATAFESKQVLGVIRKVLKQSTKDVVARLQEPEEEEEEEDAAADVADDASDGPPGPPPLESEVGATGAAPSVAGMAAEAAPVETKRSRHASAAEEGEANVESEGRRTSLPAGGHLSSEEEDDAFED